MKLFLATGNQHKVIEMKQILAEVEIEILSPKDFDSLPEVIEDAGTFEGNALKKARELCEVVNLPTVADDSGLVVETLGGKPGVYSARFAGEEASDQENNDKLLSALEDVPKEDRDAYFICVMVFVTPDGEKEVVSGRCEGKIGFKPRGQQGFGYDPLFIPEGYNQSFAQLGEEVKNRISHRAKALSKMKEVILDYKK